MDHSLELRIDLLDSSYLKKMTRRLILGYVMTHKLPWKQEFTHDSHYVVKDAWKKPVLTSPDLTEAEEIIWLAEAALERQRINFPDGYKKIFHLWETIEREDKKIDRALRKEDENDFRNMPLIS